MVMICSFLGLLRVYVVRLNVRGISSYVWCPHFVFVFVSVFVFVFK